MTVLEETLDASDLLVTCGPGGVGKTTTAAALGLAAARRGRRTVVLTVDPARRLAEALGLDPDAKTDDPHEVEGVARRASDGELHAVMLDAESTFDRLVREQSESREQADSILRNPVYRAISGSLAGAQEYMAIERLHQLHTSGEWDLVIVDTPPSRHALDLLEAPDRLVGFLSHPVYRALTVGQRTFARVTGAAASAFLWAVRRLAGPQIVEDTIEFFRSLGTIEDGLRRRAGEVSELLRAETTNFVVVTSPRAEAISEAEHLLEGLDRGDYPFGGVVVNLVHPLPDALSASDERVLGGLDDGPLLDHVEFHRSLTELAEAEREEIAELRELVDGGSIVEVPLLDVDVHDVSGLAVLADALVGPPQRAKVKKAAGRGSR